MRNRMTKEQANQLERQIYNALVQDRPQSVRHIFYLMTNPRLNQPVKKSDKGYKVVQKRMANMRMRGQIPFAWVIEVEQRYIKKVSPEKRLFLVWKKAQSLNETRMPKRLPDDKVRSIAETVTQAANDGTAGLKYRAYYKVAFNQNQ